MHGSPEMIFDLVVDAQKSTENHPQDDQRVQ